MIACYMESIQVKMLSASAYRQHILIPEQQRVVHAGLAVDGLREHPAVVLTQVPRAHLDRHARLPCLVQQVVQLRRAVAGVVDDKVLHAQVLMHHEEVHEYGHIVEGPAMDRLDAGHQSLLRREICVALVSIALDRYKPLSERPGHVMGPLLFLKVEKVECQRFGYQYLEVSGRFAIHHIRPRQVFGVDIIVPRYIYT
jgi:hypothetical protein